MANVITFIGARGGSKGLPRKNLRLLGGQPLIAHVINDARQAKLVDRVCVFTDDPEIADVAVQFGAEVPFLLPEEMCTDDQKIEVVAKYAIERLERDDAYATEIVVYLQSTDFFRKPEWIDWCVGQLLADPALETAFTVQPTHKNYWHKDDGVPTRFRAADGQYGSRQTRRLANYREDTGMACATRAEVIKRGQRVGRTVKMLEYDSFWWDIHTEFDLWLVEQVMTQWMGRDARPV
jgi:CMP-N,N'-diacetyllegionaminic acid synthase